MLHGAMAGVGPRKCRLLISDPLSQNNSCVSFSSIFKLGFKKSPRRIPGSPSSGFGCSAASWGWLVIPTGAHMAGKLFSCPLSPPKPILSFFKGKARGWSLLWKPNALQARMKISVVCREVFAVGEDLLSSRPLGGA